MNTREGPKGKALLEDEQAREEKSPTLSRRRFLERGALFALTAPAALAGLQSGMALAQGQENQEEQTQQASAGQASSIPNVSAVLMDSYGTVFDTGYIGQALQGIVPNPQQFAKDWFDVQTMWTITLGAMGPHAYFDWWELTHRTLRWLMEKKSVQLTEQEFDQAMQAWLNIPPYPDADVFVQQLQQAGIPNAILSNGSPMMLEAAAQNTGWLDALEHLISVDRAHVYKANPNVYLLASDVFGVPAKEDLIFISAHGYDV